MYRYIYMKITPFLEGRPSEDTEKLDEVVRNQHGGFMVSQT